jgi:hypothetical protein
MKTSSDFVFLNISNVVFKQLKCFISYLKASGEPAGNITSCPLDQRLHE